MRPDIVTNHSGTWASWENCMPNKWSCQSPLPFAPCYFVSNLGSQHLLVHCCLARQGAPESSAPASAEPSGKLRPSMISRQSTRRIWFVRDIWRKEPFKSCRSVSTYSLSWPIMTWSYREQKMWCVPNRWNLLYLPVFFFPLLYQHLVHSDSISATNAPGHTSTFLCFQLPAQVLQAFQTFACPKHNCDLNGWWNHRIRWPPRHGATGNVFQYEMFVSVVAAGKVHVSTWSWSNKQDHTEATAKYDFPEIACRVCFPEIFHIWMRFSSSPGPSILTVVSSRAVNPVKRLLSHNGRINTVFLWSRDLSC